MIGDAAHDWTNEQLEQLAVQIMRDGESHGIRLRALGGIAVRLLCKDVIKQNPQLDRKCADIDLAGLARDTRQIGAVLARQGFQPNKEFNFVNESRRLMFSNGNLKVDVLLDEFRMNHAWPIQKRLFPGSITLPFEDLVLSKLQVVHLTKKDYLDLLSLGLSDLTETVNICYLIRTSTCSWGFTHTVIHTSERVVRQSVQTLGNNAQRVTAFYGRVLQEIKLAHKGFSWHLRSLLKERLRWYDPAEEPALAERRK